MPKKSRNHQARHVANSRVRKRNAEIEMHALLHQRGHLHQELQRPADQNANRQRNRGTFEVVPDHSYGKENNGAVQQYRRGGGQSENMEAVQDAHGQRSQPNEEQVGENDAVQRDGFIPVQVLRGRRDKRVNDRWRENHAQER